ncbi:MAG: TolC family protein [Desulfosarcina sp.]|nr:TolC family protein [Desulfosarcina sp.]
MAATRITLTFCCLSIFSLMTILPATVSGREPVSGPESTRDAADGPARQPLTSWFSIQVSALPELSKAENEVSRLREKGYDPYYRFEDTGSKGMWYRVYVGRYPTQKEAQQTAERLIAQRVVKSYLLRKMLAEKDIFYSVPSQETGFSSADREVDEKGASAPLPKSEQAPADTMQMGASTAIPGRPVQAALGNGSDRVGSPDSASTAVRLTLMDAIRYSLEGNREIDVAAYDPKQAQAQIEGEESVYDPLLFADSTFRRDPNLDSSVTDIVTEDDGRARAGVRKPLKTGGTLSTYLETRYADLNHAAFPRTYKHIVAPTVELQQPLLNNIGSKKEKTAIKIANYRATISAADFRRKVIDVTSSVATVYWKLFLFKELIDINRVNLDMAEEVHRRESERYARGLSQQLDVQRARSNAQVRRSTLLRSQEEYKLAMDRLKLLLNWQEFNIDSTAQVIPIESPRTTPLNPDETEAIETALSNRPEIIKAQQELMIREVDQKLAAHQRLPTLDAYGRYSVSGYGNDHDRAWSDVSVNDDDIWEVGLQFEWAFGNRAAESQYRKKSLGRLQADAQLKRVKDEIKLDVKQVLHRLATARGEIDANRSAKEAAEKVVEGEFTRFDIGQTSNEELLRAQDLLAMTSRSFARAVADYNTTIQELTRAQGILPDGVTIEEAVR